MSHLPSGVRTPNLPVADDCDEFIVNAEIGGILRTGRLPKEVVLAILEASFPPHWQFKHEYRAEYTTHFTQNNPASMDPPTAKYGEWYWSEDNDHTWVKPSHPAFKGISVWVVAGGGGGGGAVQPEEPDTAAIGASGSGAAVAYHDFIPAAELPASMNIRVGKGGKGGRAGGGAGTHGRPGGEPGGASWIGQGQGSNGPPGDQNYIMYADPGMGGYDAADENDDFFFMDVGGPRSSSGDTLGLWHSSTVNPVSPQAFGGLYNWSGNVGAGGGYFDIPPDDSPDSHLAFTLQGGAAGGNGSSDSMWQQVGRGPGGIIGQYAGQGGSIVNGGGQHGAVLPSLYGGGSSGGRAYNSSGGSAVSGSRGAAPGIVVIIEHYEL